MAEEQIGDLSIKNNEQVGDYLRRVRVARNMDLEHLAKSIRLGNNVLQAIEENQWEKFPTEAYLRSYIASICEKLSIDKMMVLKKFSIDRNSNFSIRQVNTVEEQDGVKSNNNNAAKIVIAFIFVIMIVLLFVNKTLNRASNEMYSDEEYEPEAKTAEEFLAENAADYAADTLNQSEPAAEAVAANNSEVVKTARELDTLRFECTHSTTDNTCGISLKGLDAKMYYFSKMANRFINHNDSTQVTITVPWRTKMFVNGAEIKIGRFNTLIFYNGQIVDSRNRSL